MTNYRPTQSALSFLLNTVSQYQAPCVFLYAAAVLLIVSVITGGKRARAAFLWPAVVLAATVFNPYVFPLLLSIRAEIVEHYFEFLWAVPATLIIAGGAVAAIFRIQNKAVHVLLFTAGVVLLMFFGIPSLGSGLNVNVSGDFTKADAEVMYLCDYITSHADKDRPYVAFDDPHCATEAMMYDASIRISDLFYGAQLQDGNAAEAGASGESSAGTVREDFIVISTSNLQLGDRLADLGYQDVLWTNTYHIYSKNPVQ